MIACALCVGDAPEPYLATALSAIAPVVDVLVVNDNSGLVRSDALATIEQSPFAAEGRLVVGRSPFVDFAAMRNDAQALLSALPAPPDWVLFLDADEVHGEQLRYLAAGVLPRLDAGVAELDAYTFHFFGTFGWISDVARRMAFYRFAPTLRWVNPVHEKLDGLSGKTIVVPYIYHHYGNVQSPAMLARKHGRYFELGNPVPRPPSPDDATDEVYLAKAVGVRPYRGRHPRIAVPLVARIERENATAFAALDAGFAARRSAGVRVRTALQGANEALRVALRRLEHPGLYRAATVAE
jgi:hypothetical protein